MVGDLTPVVGDLTPVDGDITPVGGDFTPGGGDFIPCSPSPPTIMSSASRQKHDDVLQKHCKTYHIANEIHCQGQ